MNIVIITLISLALSLDVLRSSFFFSQGKYPKGHRLREAMWRVVAMAFGGFVGWLLITFLPMSTNPFGFALLMLVGVKMLWTGIKDLPFDADDRFHAGSALMVAASVNAFLAGLALGLDHRNYLASALLLGFFVLIMQSVSHRLAEGRLAKNPLFRPAVAGGVLLVLVELINFFYKNL